MRDYQHLECPICLGLVKSAVTTSCGHCFCASCILSLASDNKKIKCPVDRQAISFLVPTYMLRDEVAQLIASVNSQEEQIDAPEETRIFDTQVAEYNQRWLQQHTVVERVQEDVVVWRNMFQHNVQFKVVVAVLAIFCVLYFLLPQDLMPGSRIDDLFICFLAGGFLAFLVDLKRAALVRRANHRPSPPPVNIHEDNV